MVVSRRRQEKALSVCFVLNSGNWNTNPAKRRAERSAKSQLALTVKEDREARAPTNSHRDWLRRAREPACIRYGLPRDDKGDAV